MMRIFTVLFLTFLMTGFAFGTDYLISTQGDFDTYRDDTFSPGDRILLERGGVFTGMLEPRGSGTDGNVITISAYGTGDLPVIHNEGVFHSTQGNSISACIYLFNVEYWEVNNIECTNYSSASGSGNSLNMYGVYVRAEDTADPYDHIYIEDCYIHHINVELNNNIKNADKKRGGIHVHGKYTGSAHAGWFNDVRIVNNYIEYIGGVGIGTDGHDRIVDGHTFLGDSRPGAWTNLYIADNYIGYTGRNNMIIRDCDYAMIEYNTLAYSSRDSSGHSCYNYTTLGITFQYNEAYGNTGSGKDRGGFDADNMSKDTVIQYNYSHNNEWFCGIMKDEHMNITVRYNLSVNERQGAYYYGFENDDEAYNIKVYNNTHYFKSSITPEIMAYDRTPVNTRFNNNIFYCEGSGVMGLNAENGDNNVYDNNVYYNITPPTVEINPIITDPLFVSPGAEPYNVDMRNGRHVLAGYRLSLASPHIDAGLTISNDGGHDFWGEPVPEGDTDIGASENLTVIPPGPATVVSPANGATGVSRTADISWNAGAGAATHDVYFGTDSTPDAGEFIGNQAPTTYDPGLLSPNTTYYWAIYEVNGAGSTGGSVWSFTTGTQITPVVTVSSATDIDITSATLHGEVTDTAGEIPSVTLYYGDDDAGKVAGSWDDSVSIGTQSSTFSTDISDLAVGTTYYYRAFADNSTGSDWSDVSSFETASSMEIVFDAVSGGKNNATTFSWEHELGGGDDRVVVVGIGIEQSDVIISSVTFGREPITPRPMTLAVGSLQNDTTNLTAIYYMLEADLPSAGPYDIVITTNTGDSIGAGAISLENVKQGPPEAVEKVGLGRGNTYISKDITTLTDGAWIVDVVGSGDNSLLNPDPPTDGPQERRYWYKPSSSAVAGSTRVVSTAKTVVNSWTADKSHRISLSMAAFAPVEVVIDPIIPPTVVNVAATNITSNSATLNGEVTDNGGEDTTVMIYWGDNDGVTTIENWDHIELLGTQNSTFSEDISSLSAEIPYYFRAYAYNSAGGNWADSTALFATIANTPPVWTVDPTDKADAIEDKPYVGSLSGDATDSGDVLEYSYVSGPAWLGIAANGDLSGTPTQNEVGGSSWTVSVTDGLSTPVEATVNITVLEIYDGENGLEDLAKISSLWSQTACGYCQGSDLNYDGDVGIDDLQIMAARWLSAP